MLLMSSAQRRPRAFKGEGEDGDAMPTNQSILVSGESGAGKTVTTKIVLNYLAMLSKVATLKSSPGFNYEDVSIEQQVLQSNPILESFGNARTIRNDNSSRFGKYIDIRFQRSGKLTGASIETYLLEKVRLIHPSPGERNYHVFYQLLCSATDTERELFYLDEMVPQDFKLLNQSGCFDRRDGVSDESNHQEMLDAMITIGFRPETIQSLMRLIVAVLFAGNMTFTTYPESDTCTLDETHASLAMAALLGVTFEELAFAITSRTIATVHDTIEKRLDVRQATKACEALMKAIYGAAFDFIVRKVNDSIQESTTEVDGGEEGVVGGVQTASIGVLDIFGFETFETNNFEQLCINYTNEALQQQFNRYVFKLEQLEYEKEGILWKYIAFPDNQDVIDLIDMRHIGVLAILDEQCIIPQSTDETFSRYLYSKCDHHRRFSASPSQRVEFRFSIDHYAGKVEYSTDSWIEKNKDELPSKSAALLKNSTFKLLTSIQRYIRSETRRGRSGTVVTKSVGAQFSSQLNRLRERIDITTPHYIRCLKPNDNLLPEYFEPKNIVEQLRCGGVLEAVRVSRAGYPTRYPHDVFLARYYILGDKDAEGEEGALSPMVNYDETSSWQTSKAESLKRLISKIAFDVWEADNFMMVKLLEAEKAQDEMRTPKYAKNSTSAPVFFQGSSIVNGPQSLAVKTTSTTTRQTKKPSSTPKLSLTSIRERTSHSQNITRPTTIDEFLSHDFVSRCAIAGLQLGRTKVFLRREAFDRIESMRSGKFYGSAVYIQAIVRGRIQRGLYRRTRCAAVRLQTWQRRASAVEYVERFRVDVAVTRIQCAWRQGIARGEVRVEMMRIVMAAVRIQRAYRSFNVRSCNEDAEYRAAVSIQARQRGIRVRNGYFTLYLGTIRLQALERGRSARAGLMRERLAVEEQKEKEAYEAAEAQRRATELEEERRAAELEAAAAEEAARAAEQAATPLPSPLTQQITEIQPLDFQSDAQRQSSSSLYASIQEQDWAKVESILDKYPILAEAIEPESGELPLHVIARYTSAWTLLVDMVLVLNPKALIHRDNMGALPVHHASAHDNLAALEIIFSAYKEGINDVDAKGRLPLHVAAEFDAVESVKFLLAKNSEGAFTMVSRPQDGSGGGLPLHVACRNYASIGVITALLAENFASAKRCDENGDLPLHLILKCGSVVNQTVVKTLMTCFPAVASRTDMNGDLPLAIAIKNRCQPAVVNSILMQYPSAASALGSDGQSTLHLAFEFACDDRTILGLLNHAPELATVVDKKTGILPIQVATENEHSHFIVHNLLKRDLPIDVDEKVRAQLLPHNYSWNHIVSNTDDMYHQVVTKILQQCTQPQVLALAHVAGADGKIALASATAVCKHELRIMLRLFNTLEVVNQRPAYTNPISDTQIFYALRYEPPAMQNAAFTIVHDEKRDQVLGDYIEDWDDTSVVSNASKQSMRSTLSGRSQASIDDKLRHIRKEKGQQVIAKLTSRSDIVERELKVRKDFHLSRHYVPAVISVHHTVQHAAYSEAMAEPGYCITMEGADTTAENLLLDMRRANKPFPVKALKRIGIALLHMHEHGLVHCDFGTHNIGKFGGRWKLLGVGGSVPVKNPTNPNRGFYHPPESIVVEKQRAALGKKSTSAVVVSIPALTTYDIWAFGVVMYEAIACLPLSPYACRGKRAMSSSEVGKIGQWDVHSLKKALKNVPEDSNNSAKSIVRGLLHYNPESRFRSMREVLEHPFFAGSSSKSSTPSNRSRKRTSAPMLGAHQDAAPQPTETRSLTNSSSSGSSPQQQVGVGGGGARPKRSVSNRRGVGGASVVSSAKQAVPLGRAPQLHDENVENGTGPKTKAQRHSNASTASTAISRSTSVYRKETLSGGGPSSQSSTNHSKVRSKIFGSFRNKLKSNSKQSLNV